MRWDEREDDKAQSDQTHRYKSEGREAASDAPSFVEAVFQYNVARENLLKSMGFGLQK